MAKKKAGLHKVLLTPRGRKLCERFCEENNINPDEIDDTLTRGENMKHLRSLTQKSADAMYRDSRAMRGQVIESEQKEKQMVDRLVDDLKTIIKREKKVVKEAKFQVGERILKDEEFLTRQYGDDYFGGLARKLKIEGYSTSQLYVCVTFAKHPKAKEWLEDDKTPWTKIYHELLPKRPKRIVEKPCGEAGEVIQNMESLLHQLACIYVDREIQRKVSKRWKECSVCSFKVLCKFAQERFWLLFES